MRKYTKAWLSLEGAFLWFVVMVIALSLDQGWFTKYFPVSEKNGWGRILAFPSVSVAHLVVSLAILSVMGLEGGIAKAFRFIMGLAAVCMGLYSLWSPGVLATSFPLGLGGLLVALRVVPRRTEDGRQ